MSREELQAERELRIRAEERAKVLEELFSKGIGAQSGTPATHALQEEITRAVTDTWAVAHERHERDVERVAPAIAEFTDNNGRPYPRRTLAVRVVHWRGARGAEVQPGDDRSMLNVIDSLHAVVTMLQPWAHDSRKRWLASVHAGDPAATSEERKHLLRVCQNEMHDALMRDLARLEVRPATGIKRDRRLEAVNSQTGIRIRELAPDEIGKPVAPIRVLQLTPEGLQERLSTPDPIKALLLALELGDGSRVVGRFGEVVEAKATAWIEVKP